MTATPGLPTGLAPGLHLGRLARVALVVALCVAPGVGTVGDEVTSMAVPRWNELTFEAKKLFMTATTEIRLAAAPQANLVVSPKGRALDPEHSTLRLQLEAEALGRRSSETVVFDGRDGATFLREKQKHGSKAYSKTFRFAQDGVFRWRAEPSNSAEADKAKDQWSRRSEEWFAAPTGCQGAIDPAALLHLASARAIAPGGWPKGESESYCVFSNKGFSKLTLTSDGVVERQVSFDVDGSAVDGEIDVIRLLATGSPLGSGDEPMELLGLEGDVEIYVDARRGLPVEVCGDLSPVGRVEVKLARASTR